MMDRDDQGNYVMHTSAPRERDGSGVVLQHSTSYHDRNGQPIRRVHVDPAAPLNKQVDAFRQDGHYLWVDEDEFFLAIALGEARRAGSVEPVVNAFMGALDPIEASPEAIEDAYRRVVNTKMAWHTANRVFSAHKQLVDVRRAELLPHAEGSNVAARGAWVDGQLSEQIEKMKLAEANAQARAAAYELAQERWRAVRLMVRLTISAHEQE